MNTSDQGKSPDPTVARAFWQTLADSPELGKTEPMPGTGVSPRRRSRRRLRFLMFAVTAVVLTGVVLGAYAADAFRDTELDTVDTRFSIRGDQDPPEEVVVVAIDDVTFGELQQRWPFPRTLPRARDRPPARGRARRSWPTTCSSPSRARTRPTTTR